MGGLLRPCPGKFPSYTHHCQSTVILDRNSYLGSQSILSHKLSFLLFRLHNALQILFEIESSCYLKNKFVSDSTSDYSHDLSVARFIQVASFHAHL